MDSWCIFRLDRTSQSTLRHMKNVNSSDATNPGSCLISMSLRSILQVEIRLPLEVKVRIHNCLDRRTIEFVYNSKQAEGQISKRHINSTCKLSREYIRVQSTSSPSVLRFIETSDTRQASRKNHASRDSESQISTSNEDSEDKFSLKTVLHEKQADAIEELESIFDISGRQLESHLSIMSREDEEGSIESIDVGIDNALVENTGESWKFRNGGAVELNQKKQNISMLEDEDLWFMRMNAAIETPIKGANLELQGKPLRPGSSSEDPRQRKEPLSQAEANAEYELTKFKQLMKEGNMKNAQRIVEQLQFKFPDNPKVQMKLAYFERKNRKMAAATALFSQTIELLRERNDLGLDYIRTLQGWGSLEAESYNYRRARFLYMESIRAAKQLESQVSDVNLQGMGVYGLHAWAMLEEKLGNWSKARNLLEHAAAIQPKNAVVLQSRALLELRAHNWSSARYFFRLAVEADPKDVKSWHAFALFEASQGKRRLMRKLFKLALQADPRNIHTLQAWAHQEALIGTEETRNQARKLYRKCIELNPRSVYSWQSWAILEKNSGNFNGARILFERGLSANPSSVPCLQAYAHMERVLGNLETSQKLVMRAINIEPENAAALMEAGLIQQKLGNEEAALEFFKQAANSDKQKSRVKRRMFESRKESPPPSLSKSKKVGKMDGHPIRKQINRSRRKSGNQGKLGKKCANPNDSWEQTDRRRVQ